LERTINFLKYKNIIFSLSWLLVVFFIVLTIVTGGFNWGIDFVGGYKIVASFQDTGVNEGTIRTLLRDFDPSVQRVGDASRNEYIITTKLEVSDKKPVAATQNVCLGKNDMLKKTLFEKYPQITFVSVENAGRPELYRLKIRFSSSSVNEALLKDQLKDYDVKISRSGSTAANEFIILADFARMNQDEVQGVECGVEHLKLTLSSRHSGVKIQSEETVGPAIGEYLRKSAWKLTLLAIILMSVYLAFRFEIKYSVGAMCSLVHDIAMSIAFCGIMGIEFDITILAALLTLYGYSVNDTIVVFDRIREINQLKSKITFTEIINKGITQTLVRTILTGVATLYTLSVIYFVGGETLRDFALVMIFGILVGTFSSIFIAPPALLWWEKWRSK